METRVGRYRIEREIGRGGVGAVFRALDPAGTPVALKVHLAGALLNEQQRRRFSRELEALLALRHEHLIALIDGGTHRGAPFLVTEWVDGETLTARLEREGPLDPRAAAGLVRRLAAGVAHAHARGVLHRDIKPDNVLLRREDGAPLLIDFGLTRDVDQAGSQLTRTGQLLGTPGWMPPEQARGDKQAIGPRSDVYGLGALLYAALTGAPPHEGETALELLVAVERDPKPPSAHRPGLPRGLEAICLRALSRAPERRQRDADELGRELEAWAAGPGEGPRPDSRRLLLAGAGAAVLIAAALVLVPLGSQSRATSLVAGESAAAASTLASEPDPLLLARRGGRAAALSSLDARIAGRPDDPELLVLRAQVRPAHARAAALADLDRALQLAPEHLLARLLRARLRAERGDRAGARADLDALGSREPVLPREWATRALVRHLLRDRDGASADVERALVGDPFDRDGLIARIRLGLAARRPREVLGDLERLIEHDREDLEALTLRACALVTSDPLGNRGRIESDLARVLAREPDSTAALLVQVALRVHERRFADALEDVERVLVLDPEEVAALQDRSLLHDYAGRLEPALADVERVLARDPDDPAALAQRGHVRLRLNQLTEAREDIDRALALEPELAEALLERARLRIAAGDVEGGLADADRILATQPHQLDALLLRLAALEQLRDPASLAAAGQQLERLVAERPDDPSVAFARGRWRYAMRDPGALADFDRALALDPNHDEARAARGACLERAGAYRAALATFDQVLARLPRNEEALLGRSSVRIHLGDLAGALEDAERLLALGPLPRRWIQRGRVLQCLGRTAEALADLDRGLAGDPDHLGGRVHRGEVRDALGDPVGAEQDLRAALAAHPARSEPHMALALFHERQRRPDEALRAAERALELDPGQVDALMCVTRILTKRRDLDGARRAADRAVEAAPESQPARAERGLVRYEQGDLPGALADLDAAVELAPQEPRARLNRGVVLLALGRIDEARADYDRVLELEPGNAGALRNRSSLHLKRGDVPAAIADLDAAIRIEPLAISHSDRGGLHARDGRPDQAIADFDAALRLEPHHELALKNRAVVRLQQDDLAGALRDAEALAAAHPNGDTLPFLARMRQRAGDDRGAAEAYRRLLELLPPDHPDRPGVEHLIRMLER